MIKNFLAKNKKLVVSISVLLFIGLLLLGYFVVTLNLKIRWHPYPGALFDMISVNPTMSPPHPMGTPEHPSI